MAEAFDPFAGAPLSAPAGQHGRAQLADEMDLDDDIENQAIMPAGDEADPHYTEHPLKIPGNIWKAMANFQKDGSSFLLQNYYAGSSRPGGIPGSASPPASGPRASAECALWHNFPTHSHFSVPPGCGCILADDMGLGAEEFQVARARPPPQESTSPL